MIRAGNIVRVRFRDHCEQASKTVACVVYGRLLDIGPRDLTVRCWEALFRSHADRDRNSNDYVILRSAVERIDVLTPGEAAK